MSNVFARLFEEGDRQQQQLQPPTQPLVKREEVIVKPPETDSMTARQQSVETARRQDSTTVRQHDSIHEYIQTFLETRSTNKTTLRYPPTLMEELDEVIYQIKKTYKQTLSKNEVFVLGLAYVMCDFKRNASRSLVFKELIKEEDQK
jgi:hypothetical protein